MEQAHPFRTDHESEFGRWTLLRASPPRWLRPYIREILGYSEETATPVLRKELPSCVVPMILVLGNGFSLHDISRPYLFRPLPNSFVAGSHEQHALVGSAGHAICMQVDFTPLGARRLLKIDLEELAGRVVDLDDVIGAFTLHIEDLLRDANNWEARFSILIRALAERIIQGADNNPIVVAALTAIEESRGQVRIGTLANDLGYSRKHLSKLFRRETGLTPKSLARVLRFEEAMTALRSGRYGSLVELAASCGYADQSHFTRDFTMFAGESPTRLLPRILPDGTGIIAAPR